MERHTSTVAKCVLAQSASGHKDQMLEVCDLELARLVKRVRRHPGAMHRMKVVEAHRVAEYLLGTGVDADVVVARDALGRDKRVAMADIRTSARARQILDEDAIAARLDGRKQLDAATLEEIREWSSYHYIEPHSLLEWCVEDADRAMAVAHIELLDRRAVVMRVLDGTLTMSINGFLAASRLSPYQVRQVLNLRDHYTGALTNDLLDLIAEHQVDPLEWTFSSADDDVVLRCVRRSGTDQGLSPYLCISLYENGLMDGWLLDGETLDGNQRNAAALAAAQKRDFSLVNALLAKHAFNGTQRNYRYDISDLLSGTSAEHLSTRAVVECAQHASGDQLLRWAQHAMQRDIDAVSVMLASDGCDKVLEWMGNPRMLATGARRLVEALVRGQACGAALRTSSTVVGGVIAEILLAEIGNDVALCRMVLSLGENWSGTLDELIAASHVCLRG